MIVQFSHIIFSFFAINFSKKQKKDIGTSDIPKSQNSQIAPQSAHYKENRFMIHHFFIITACYSDITAYETILVSFFTFFGSFADNKPGQPAEKRCKYKNEYKAGSKNTGE